VHLAASSPGAEIVAVDVSEESLARARARLARTVPGARIAWRRADLLALPPEEFPEAGFDHLFVCFVLEHLADPRGALARLRRLLRPGGTLTVIEGDHGAAVFHPHGAYAQATVDCAVRLQVAAGGDALLGRRLWPLVTGAGFAEVTVRPRTMYADGGRPELVEAFTRNTFIAMIESFGDEALAAGLCTGPEWRRGIAELRRAAGPDGTLSYTFFKACAVRPRGGGSGDSGKVSRQSS
jgi:SAM-dependent methyltransferase